MDLTNWQKNIPGEIPLSLINIPGTHDSSTQFVKLSAFSRCQDKSIGLQLENGIRLLDIRLELRDSVFYAVHGIADCRTKKKSSSPLLLFNDIFGAVCSFLKKHPSETIITAIKMDRGSNHGAFFPALYEQFIQPNKSIWYLENRIPNLDECRGKLVLMRRCATGESTYSFTDVNTGLNFTNSYDRLPDKNGIALPCPVEVTDSEFPPYSTVIQDSYMLNPIQKWRKAVKPSLKHFKPGEEVIAVNYLSTAGMPFIPRINSKYVNCKFNAYSLKNRENCGWICMDFPTVELVVKIINSNFKVVT